jgi:conjugal transfer/type IV secretion protein DotA/TraY
MKKDDIHYHIQNAGYLALFILFWIMFWPQIGFAATDPAAQSYTQQTITSAAMGASDPDLSGIGMLRKVFGDVVNNPFIPSNSAGETALGTVFGVINMSLLALGSIFLSYNVIVGIAQTAQDGQFLGKRFSSMWVPIRLGAGVVSLVPVYKGWAICQLLMLGAATSGVGIANLATSAVTKYVDTNYGTVVNIPAIPTNEKMVRDIYYIHLCMSAVNVADANSMKETTAGGQILYGRGGQDSTCGIVQLPTSKNPAAASANLEAFQTLDGIVGAHTDQLLSDMKADFDQVQGGVKAPFPNLTRDADIAGYTVQYQDTLRSNLRSALNTTTHIKSDLSNIGFAGLGIFYSKLSSAGDSVNEAAQTQAVIIKPAPSVEGINFAGVVGDDYQHVKELLVGHEAKVDSALSSLKVPPSAEAILAEFNSKALKNIPSSCNGNPGAGVGQSILFSAINATGCQSNALNRMKETGDWLSMTGWLGIGLAATAKGVVAAAGSIPIIGAGIAGGVGVFIGIFLTLMETMTFFSSMLSTYLPLLPYVAWLGAIISWLTVVIEGVVAAPLWAFAHMDTEGEGMGQRAQHGYLFILNVLFRPVLMVVGFLSSIIVIDVVGKFFFLTYTLAVSESSAGSFTGLVAMIIYVGAFFTISVMIVNTSINLIHLIPDTVLNWISESTASSSAGAGANGNFAIAATGATGAGAGMVKESLRKLGGAAVGDGVEKSRDSREKRDE